MLSGAMTKFAPNKLLPFGTNHCVIAQGPPEFSRRVSFTQTGLLVISVGIEGDSCTVTQTEVSAEAQPLESITCKVYKPESAELAGPIVGFWALLKKPFRALFHS